MRRLLRHYFSAGSQVMKTPSVMTQALLLPTIYFLVIDL